MNIHSAIIKGPEKNKLQDAMGIINQKYYDIFIVADGLGSRENSDFGANQTIKAVEQAVVQWRKLNKKDIKVLIQLIHFHWNLLVGDSNFDRNDCLTTCLFAYLEKESHKIILGQLGDGLILLKSEESSIIVKSEDAYNYTKALGSSKSYNDWNIRELEIDINDFYLLLATDGISEDIVQDKENVFAEEIIKQLLKIKPKKKESVFKANFGEMAYKISF